MDSSKVEKITVGECRKLIVEGCTRVLKGNKIIDAVEAILEDARTHSLYVVDEDDKLLGTIGVMKLIEVATVQVSSVTGAEEIAHVGPLKRWRYKHVEVVDDIMKKPYPVRDDHSIIHALDLMEKHNLFDLPVTDDHGKVLGELNGLEVLERLSQENLFGS